MSSPENKQEISGAGWLPCPLLDGRCGLERREGMNGRELLNVAMRIEGYLLGVLAS